MRFTDRADLAGRLREIRKVLYGEDGAPLMARALDLPAQTWLNYEQGVIMPADILLRFLDLTEAEPRWLLVGEGDRFRTTAVA